MRFTILGCRFRQLRTYQPVLGWPPPDYTRWSNGQQSVFDYLFLPPTPKNLAKLRPVIPAGYLRAGCAQATSPTPGTRHFPPPK